MTILLTNVPLATRRGVGGSHLCLIYCNHTVASSTSISQDTEFSVSEDASKSQIKTAFVKSLKSKKMNRRILGEFVSLVA